jgi:hypothetical protein
LPVKAVRSRDDARRDFGDGYLAVNAVARGGDARCGRGHYLILFSYSTWTPLTARDRGGGLLWNGRAIAGVAVCSAASPSMMTGGVHLASHRRIVPAVSKAFRIAPPAITDLGEGNVADEEGMSHKLRSTPPNVLPPATIPSPSVAGNSCPTAHLWPLMSGRLFHKSDESRLQVLWYNEQDFQ